MSQQRGTLVLGQYAYDHRTTTEKTGYTWQVLPARDYIVGHTVAFAQWPAITSEPAVSDGLRRRSFWGKNELQIAANLPSWKVSNWEF